MIKLSKKIIKCDLNDLDEEKYYIRTNINSISKELTVNFMKDILTKNINQKEIENV